MRKLMLDVQLGLEDPMRTPDGAGGFTESWTVLGKLWAHVMPQSGRESGDRSMMRYRIFVRQMPTDDASRPRPDQRFRDGDRIYHIEAVSDLPDDLRHLMCYAFEELAT